MYNSIQFLDLISLPGIELAVWMCHSMGEAMKAYNRAQPPMTARRDMMP